jgi:thiol-disulfide isomerase/thioredoxin
MPKAFTIGPVLVPTLPVSVILSLLVAIWAARLIAGYMQLDAPWTSRVAEASAWLGLIGARLGFVIANWSAFGDAPWTALYLWQPGYLPAAGLLAGMSYVFWRVCRYQLRERLRYLRALGTGFAVGALLLGAVVIAMQIRLEPDVLRAGDTVPDFALWTLDGKPARFSSLRGQAVVLNFWATWCPPCRRELPLLEAIQKEYRARGLTIVGVDIDEPIGLVRPYIQSIGVTYPIWVDAPASQPGYDRTREVYYRFGGIGLPTTFFINRNGVIRESHIGELNRAFLQNRIEAMLER